MINKTPLTESEQKLKNSRLQHINICTMGHVDAGKTTISSAISNITHQYDPVRNKAMDVDSIDSSPEEKERKITINTATLEFTYKDKYYTVRDNPGHKDFMKNFINGVQGIQIAILIVDCMDGLQPQTTSHLAVCKILGIENLIVCINKVDIFPAGEERNEAVEMLKETINDSLTELEYMSPEKIAKIPYIATSGLKALEGEKEFVDGIYNLLDTLNSYNIPEGNLDDDFLLSISKVFSVPGRGTVVAGNVKSGIIRLDDKLTIRGMNKDKVETVVTGIEMMHKSIGIGLPNDDIGILLRSVKLNEVLKGMIMTKSSESNNISTKLFTGCMFEINNFYVMKYEQSGRNTNLRVGERMRFAFNNSVVTGEIFHITNPNDSSYTFLEPGQTGNVVVKLDFETIFEEKAVAFCIEGSEKVSYIVGGGNMSKTSHQNSK